MENKKIVIIIPTYKEEENIFQLIKKIDKLKFKKDVIIVDDSPKILNNLKKLKKKILLIFIEEKN